MPKMNYTKCAMLKFLSQSFNTVGYVYTTKI